MRIPTVRWLRAGLLVAAFAAACGDADDAATGPARNGTTPGATTARAAKPSVPAPKADAPAKPAGRCRISGTVVHGGRPAEASVSLVPQAAAWDLDAQIWLVRDLAAPRALTALATTRSADGAFALDGVPAGDYEIRAVAADGATATASVQLASDGTSAVVALVLTPAPRAVALSGRVIGTDGKPFRGLVAFRAERWDNAPLTDATCRPTRDDGSFELQIPDVPVAFVEAMLPDRLKVTDGPVVLPLTGEYVLDLSKSLSTLRVRVTDDATGAPIAGALVGLTSETPEVGALERTDAQGVCTLAAGSSKRTVLVQAAGYPKVDGIEIPPTLTELVLPLAAGPTVRARVVRASDGSPVAGVPVYVREYQRNGIWGNTAPVRTDAGGVALVRGVRPGGALVFVAGEGWFSEGLEPGRVVGDVHRTNNHRPKQPADWVPRSGVLDLEVRVVPGADVEGRVVRHDGSPVAGASVTVGEPWKAPHLAMDLPTPSATTGPDGRFALRGLYPWVEHRIAASAPGEPGQAVEMRDPRATDELVLRFGVPHRLEVTVVDAARGTPIPGAKVVCTTPRNEGGWPNRDVAGATTDAEGRADLGAVLEGEYEVSATEPSYVTAPAQRIQVGGGKPARASLRLERGLTIRGRAVLPDGTTPRYGNAGVVPEDDEDRRFSRDDAERLAAKLADDGTFEILGVAPGTHPIRVIGRRGTEWFEGRTRAAAGGAAVEARLVAVPSPDEPTWPEQATVVVRVVGPDGRPVGRARVAAHWTEDGMSQTTTFDVVAGDVRLPRAVRGTVVTISDATTLTGIPLDAGMAQSPIPAGAEDGYEVRLPAAEVLTGRLVDESGAPLARVRVGVIPKRDADDPFGDHDLPFEGDAMTGPDGGFEIRPLGSIEYAFVAEVPEEFEPPAGVSVRGGQNDVVVTARRGLRPVIVVLGPDDAPVSGAEVTIEAGPFGFRAKTFTETTGADGRAVFAALPKETEYRLAVRAPSPDLSGRWGEWTPVPQEVVRLERLGSVAGVVADADGLPVPRVDVWCRRAGAEDSDESFGWDGAVTDAAGRFRFQGLSGGEVEIVAGNYDSSSHWSHGPRSLDDEEVAAPHAKRVRVGAEHASIALIAEHCLTVRFEGLRGTIEDDELPSIHRTDAWGALRAVRTKDPATIRFTGVAPGRTFSLGARFPRAGLIGRAADLRAGGAVTVTLEPGTDLTGRCIPPDGVVLRSLTVSFTAPPFDVRVTAGPDGTFTISCLPRIEGDLAVWAHEVGGEYHGSARATPGTPVEVRLQRRR